MRDKLALIVLLRSQFLIEILLKLIHQPQRLLPKCTFALLYLIDTPETQANRILICNLIRSAGFAHGGLLAVVTLTLPLTGLGSLPTRYSFLRFFFIASLSVDSILVFANVI